MLYNERDLRQTQALDIAQKMLVAARTAPKGKGIDVVECAVIDGDDLETLACTMEAIGDERGHRAKQPGRSACGHTRAGPGT